MSKIKENLNPLEQGENYVEEIFEMFAELLTIDMVNSVAEPATPHPPFRPLP